MLSNACCLVIFEGIITRDKVQQQKGRLGIPRERWLALAFNEEFGMTTSVTLSPSINYKIEKEKQYLV